MLSGRPSTHWEDKAYLRKHYLEKSNAELAIILDRTVGSIEVMANNLGLTGNPLKQQFRKGRIPKKVKRHDETNTTRSNQDR